MSTRVGTLQGPRQGRSIWPAAILASFVMLTIAVGVVSLGRDRPQPTPNTVVGGTAQTFVGGTAANTPSELRAATAAADIGGVRLAPHLPKRAVGAAKGSSGVGTAGNTPSEMTGVFVGGIVPKFVGRTAQDEAIMVNGHVCGQCG
ncbi:MAG TPA: hypothetical protein VJZ98_07640 [Actinomycetota bacterium]|nr:hypothetical protein [Actinomycetota bacterium]